MSILHFVLIMHFLYGDIARKRQKALFYHRFLTHAHPLCKSKINIFYPDRNQFQRNHSEQNHLSIFFAPQRCIQFICILGA